jgi:DnaK suppressor protein
MMQERCLKDYKKLLELKKNDLIQAIGDRDEIRIEKAADEFDEIQLAMNRELAIRNLDRETALLRHVAAALARTEDGRYGTCLLCEEEIPEKRLKAVPWAAHCVCCQEELDQHQRDYGSNERTQFV